MRASLKAVVAVAAVAGSLAVASPASATTFTMNEAAFILANPGLTLIDFNDTCASGVCSVPSYPNVSFSAPALVTADGGTYGAPSDWLADNTYNGYIDMTFNPAISAVGFNIAADYNNGLVDGDMTIALYSGATLLDTETVRANGFDTFDTFVGWTDLAGLDNLHITVTNAGDFVNVDNLRFGQSAAVPEPASLTLMGLGLAGLARRLRKRQS